MEANYGYSDGTGDYYIIIDTDRCDGCGLCVAACPEGLFEVGPDDFGKIVARVKESLVSRISYLCPGFNTCASNREQTCHSVCIPQTIAHTW